MRNQLVDESPLLVLVVDRDDSLGRNCGLPGPIIGQKAARRAAAALGVKDPEDPKTNTILRALHEYNLHHEKGTRTEIVVLTGDEDVGFTSDRVISRQLRRVIDETGAESCVFIALGTGEVEVLPLFSSRLHVEAVIPTVVRQAPRLEGFLYALKSYRDNPKARIPLTLTGLGLMLAGMALLVGRPGLIGIIPVAFAIFVLLKTFRLWDEFIDILTDMGQKLQQRRYGGSSIIVAFLVIVGGFYLVFIERKITDVSNGFFFAIFFFVHDFIVFFVAAIVILMAPPYIRVWQETRDPVKSLVQVPLVLQMVAVAAIVTYLAEIALYFNSKQVQFEWRSSLNAIGKATLWYLLVAVLAWYGSVRFKLWLDRKETGGRYRHLR